jgi:hypothetical protein
MKRAQFQQLENEFLKSQARNDNPISGKPYPLVQHQLPAHSTARQ